VIPVAEAGRLIGIVRRSQLEGLPADVPIGETMEPPISVGAAESAGAIDDVREFLDGGPIPVVDESGRMIGVVGPADTP
jgi:Mg/Co/Ni transporter MgtE